MKVTKVTNLSVARNNEVANRKRRKKRTEKRGLAASGVIISPWVDFLCAGGLSVVVMLGLLLYIFMRPTQDHQQIYFGSFLIFQALINWPHFMASYRLLYLPVTNIKRYPFAAIYVPALLLLVLVSIILMGGAPPAGSGWEVLIILQQATYIVWLVAAFYLAWHYTGQAWGMIATFSHLADIKIGRGEKTILRGGLRVLLLWHVLWGAQDLPESWLGPIHGYLPVLLSIVSAFALLFFVLGILAFVSVRNKNGRAPTAQMLAPWVAIYTWYLVLSYEPNVYLFVQLFHALQYIIFPLRVELNRAGVRQVQKDLLWSCRYYIMLVFFGILFFYIPDYIFASGGQVYSIGLLLACSVSIHHYFVDGCIWKISDDRVRRELFAHITR